MALLGKPERLVFRYREIQAKHRNYYRYVYENKEVVKLVALLANCLHNTRLVSVGAVGLIAGCGLAREHWVNMPPPGSSPYPVTLSDNLWNRKQPFSDKMSHHSGSKTVISEF